MARRRLIELSGVEQTMVAWQDLGVLWAGQVSVTTAPLDARQLRAACNAAIALHPLAGCAIGRGRGGRLLWMREETVAMEDVRVVPCADHDALEELRSQELGRPVGSKEAPLFRVLVARGPEYDTLIATFDQVFCDDVGMLRLLRSAALAYRDQPDKEPTVDLAGARDALESAARTGLAGRVSTVASSMTQQSRIAPSGATGDRSYGFVHRRAAAAAVLAAADGRKATFEEFALACLHVTIERWNRSREFPAERVSVGLVVNLRPEAWADDVVANLSSFGSVWTDPEDRLTIDGAINRLRPQLEPEARVHKARELATMSSMLSMLPRPLRKTALAAMPADSFDSCVLTTGVAVGDAPRFDAAHVPVVRYATVPLPAVGLNIDCIVVADEIHLRAAYWRERFDAKGAADFVAAFVESLTDA